MLLWSSRAICKYFCRHPYGIYVRKGGICNTGDKELSFCFLDFTKAPALLCWKWLKRSGHCFQVSITGCYFSHHGKSISTVHSICSMLALSSRCWSSNSSSTSWCPEKQCWHRKVRKRTRVHVPSQCLVIRVKISRQEKQGGQAKDQSPFGFSQQKPPTLVSGADPGFYLQR